MIGQPIGVSLLVTPWNFPAAMVTRKLGPALAAGCTVVLKPATETPLTALRWRHCSPRPGVPDGVVNVVTASTVGRWSARCSTIHGCASSPSPVPPRWGAGCSRRRPSGS